MNADDVIEAGWVVLDPEGNVVDSGPGMVLEMTTEIGGSDQEDSDGSDR